MQINEIFYSLQGEGVRTGTANIFVRFSGCNLTCKLETHGFDCDTEFASGRKMTPDEVLEECTKFPAYWLILTGGEPALQLTDSFIQLARQKGYKLAIETNGSIALPEGLDWICVSPKVAEHSIRQLTANEVKYVRCKGQSIPKTVVKADHYLISPAFRSGELYKEDLEWCINLVKENPQWRLSMQQHPLWKIR